MKSDLEYANHGMFTRFYANTTAGEDAWRVMAEKDGVAAVLTFQAKQVIAQLRKNGYSVSKAAKPTQTIADILEELNNL